MTDLIFAIIVIGVANSFYCIGLYRATDAGNVLCRFGSWLKPLIGNSLYSILLGCPWCMASLHGFIWFYLLTELYHMSYTALLLSFLYIPYVSGLTRFICGLMSLHSHKSENLMIQSLKYVQKGSETDR